MSRALRLLQDEPECVEQGYLVYIDFESAFGVSDLDAAFDQARDVHAWGRRFGDPNLVALGVRGQGRVLIKQGRVSDGMALPDEAMVAAVSQDLDPGWAGNIYCHLMPACYEIADWRRAGEWTGATARWCEEMPGAGPFMGICRVHRAQTLQVLGAWDDAEREVVRVCEDLARFHVSIVGDARTSLATCADSVGTGLGRKTRSGRRTASAAIRNPALPCSASPRGAHRDGGVVDPARPRHRGRS